MTAQIINLQAWRVARGALGAAGVVPGSAPGVGVAGAGLAGLVGGAVDG